MNICKNVSMRINMHINLNEGKHPYKGKINGTLMFSIRNTNDIIIFSKTYWFFFNEKHSIAFSFPLEEKITPCHKVWEKLLGKGFIPLSWAFWWHPIYDELYVVEERDSKIVFRLYFKDFVRRVSIDGFTKYGRNAFYAANKIETITDMRILG